VLPCYNEQDHVLDELERISKAMDNSGFSYELLVIDDKSTDNTLEVLQEALPRFPQVRLMPFAATAALVRRGASAPARRTGASSCGPTWT
jgi:glycosyltransferase involved in cell wall biosynthesis